MMMTLYHSPATAAMVVHWLLIDLELPHRLHALDFDKREQKSPDYLKLNPAGVVPTLVIDDGPPLCEAAAIALHLGELVPARELVPALATPARAQCYRWMFFLANTLQPAYRAWFYPTEPAGEANVEASKREARAPDRDGLGPGRGAPGIVRRTVHAGGEALRRRLHDHHVDALVAQHAEAGRPVAGAARLRVADEGTPLVEGAVPARRADRVGLNL